MEENKKNLRLFCPADKIDWSTEIQTPRELQLIKDIASRLSLAIKVDEEIGKVFLGRSETKKEIKKNPLVNHAGKVRFPAGEVNMAEGLSETEANRYGITGVYSNARLLSVSRGQKLSEHFTAGEFFCHDQSYKFVRVSPYLVEKLEEIRKAVGRPVKILSAYRPPEYNRQIGGASVSCHIDGLAADICAEGVSTERLCEIAEKVIGREGGVGYYPQQGFVHVDVRGSEARWSG